MCGPCNFICDLVNKFMNETFEEVVDFVEEKKMSAEEMFKDHDDAMRKAGNVIRPLSMLMCVVGLYFLFSPVIALLSWIPLVGSLLSAIFALAAFIFAFVVGVTISTLVLGLAWLWFRPLYGAILLTLTGVGIALIFLIPNGGGN